MPQDSRATDGALVDLPVPVKISVRTLLAKGYRDYERYSFTLSRENGGLATQTHDILRVGRAAAVLPVDPVRDEVVLFHQFRLPAHLANGNGNLVEIVAGHVEDKESIAQTAFRECIEEIGVAPKSLIELFTFLTTPGHCDEEITLYLGLVDASLVPERAGAAAEHEEMRPLCVPIDSVLAALADGKLRNGPLIIALQWLALNRDRLDEIVRSGGLTS